MMSYSRHALVPLAFAFQAASAPMFISIDAPRMERLGIWLTAVEQHEIGTDDARARRIAAWPRAQTDQLRLDLRPVLGLIQNPDATVFQTEEAVGIPRMIVYRDADLEQLRALAAQAARHGDRNRVLKRGAMLHTDIALQVPDQASAATPSASSFTVQFMDGRQSGVVNAAGHWEMARSLLESVTPPGGRPDPASDDMVRRWYQGTAAYLIAAAQLDMAHFARAVELFPRDGEILMLAGAFHETLASSGVHDVIDNARLPAGGRLTIGSVREELRIAQDLFERALRATPDLGEARIRLGHVLGRLGRPADAVEQLTRARTDDKQLRYYAALLLGRELDAAGRRAEAVAAYQRAAAIYPSAPSPWLALSELAARAGERSAAASSALAAMTLAQDSPPADPWWSYHVAAGRSAFVRLDELLALFVRRQ
jgi:tetratricopeptide (TPR) repeat protein